MIDCLLGDAFGVLSCPFWSTVVQCGARLQIHTLINLLDQVVSGESFLTGGVFKCNIVTLHIVDLWQHCVCCIKSGITRCTLIMVRYLCRMCQCRLHAVVWSHISIYTHAPSRCRTSQYRRTLSTILLTPYSMAWHWLFSRVRPKLYYWPKLLYLFV